MTEPLHDQSDHIFVIRSEDDMGRISKLEISARYYERIVDGGIVWHEFTTESGERVYTVRDHNDIVSIDVDPELQGVGEDGVPPFERLAEMVKELRRTSKYAFEAEASARLSADNTPFWLRRKREEFRRDAARHEAVAYTRRNLASELQRVIDYGKTEA